MKVLRESKWNSSSGFIQSLVSKTNVLGIAGVAMCIGAFALMVQTGVSSQGVSGKKDDGFVGSDTCRACHAEKAASIDKSTHGVKENPLAPAAKNGCEDCHGPGKKHVEAGGGKGVGGILALSPNAKTPAAQKNALCMNCHHQGRIALWSGSTHQRKDVACSDCHSVHSNNPKNLLKPVQNEVCQTCHLQVKADLLRMSHHPIREGKMQCTSCHNPHGTVTDKLIDAPSVNENCYKCHADKRGPYMWEHEPVTENCLTCHKPHGSTHAKMLVSKSPYLCQQCHSGGGHPSTLYAKTPTQEANGNTTYQALSNRGFYKGCVNCHSRVHGSNHPAGNFFVR